jgi:hypothetical protein
MIKHVVMWKLKEEAEGRDKKENALGIKKVLEGLKGKIKEIKNLEVGLNSGGDPAAWDVSLVTEFAGFPDLMKYLEHRLHKEAAAYVNKVKEERAVIDYEA